MIVAQVHTSWREEAMKDPNTSQVTILAIDDEPAVLAQIAAIAEKSGYSCHCACDAKSAEVAARDATPDLIVSGTNLSGHSGVEVCQELKEHIGHNEVPVMFLSSSQGPDIIRRAHVGGGSYYLRKPFDAAVFVQLVEKTRLAPHLN
jgi:DNA-binding response OmpR family regulator